MMATTYPHASSTFDDDEDELCPFDEVPSSKMIIEKFDQLMYEAERAPKALARNAKSFPPSAGSIMTRSTTGMSSKASINTAPHHDQNHHHRGLKDDGEEEVKIVAISALPSIESSGDTSSKRVKGSKKAGKPDIEEDQEEKQKDSGEEILKTMYQFGSGMIKSAQSILSPAPGVFRHHHEQQQQQKESTSTKHVSKLKEKSASTKRLSPEEAEDIQDMMEAQQLQEEISRRRRDHHNKQEEEEESDNRYRHHIAKLKHKIACSKRLSSSDDEREDNIPDITMEEQQHQRPKSNTNSINILKHKIACSKRSSPEGDNIPVIMEAQQEQEQQPEPKVSLRHVMSFGSWRFPSNKRGGSRDDDDDDDTNNYHEEEDGIGTEMVHDDVEEQLRMLDSIVESAVSTPSSSSSTKERGNLSRDEADNIKEEQVVGVEDGVLTRDELFGNIRMFTVSTNTKNGGGDGTPAGGSKIGGNIKGGTTDDDKKSSSRSASTSVLTPEQKQKRVRRRRIETFMIYVLLFLSAFVMLYLGLKHRSRKGADAED